MGKSLAEYAAERGRIEPPATEIETMKGIAAAAKDRQQEAEDAAALKASIAEQIEQGQEPQYILYTAIKCIGLLTHDPAFTEAATGQLDAVYADLAQQSLFNDNAIIAGQRLQDKTQRYNEKLRTQINRQLAAYKGIADALTGALETLNRLERTAQENDGDFLK